MAPNAIASIAYDPAKLELRIVFANGRLTLHRGVPEAIHAALQASERQAEFYIAHIRGQYPFE